MTTWQWMLGTASWGQPYGLQGRPARSTSDTVKDLLEYAQMSGINSVDTAIGYGYAEKWMGEAGVGAFEVTTKLPRVPIETKKVDSWVVKQVTGSIRRLVTESVAGVLLHEPSQLTGPMGAQILDGLLRVKSEGKALKIGISIYEPAILDQLDRLKILRYLDIVQAPVNAFDRRMVTTGWASRLSSMNIELHARSVFLQGILLNPVAELPPRLQPFESRLSEWWSFLESSGSNALGSAISAVENLPGISRIIMGVDSVDQIKAILEAPRTGSAFKSKSSEHEIRELIDPRTWS